MKTNRTENGQLGLCEKWLRSICARFDNEFSTWNDWLKYKRGEEPDERRIFRCIDCGYEAPEEHFRRPFMERLMCKQCESVSIEMVKEKE